MVLISADQLYLRPGAAGKPIIERQPRLPELSAITPCKLQLCSCASVMGLVPPPFLPCDKNRSLRTTSYSHDSGYGKVLSEGGGTIGKSVLIISALLAGTVMWGYSYVGTILTTSTADGRW